MKFYQPIKKNFECIWIVTLNVLLGQAWYRDKSWRTENCIFFFPSM